MTINSENRQAGPFTCDGIVTEFPFAFRVFEAADVVVLETALSGVETKLVMNTDYTVTLSEDQNESPGGHINMVVAPTWGKKLTLTSELEFTQQTQIPNLGAFYPEVVTDALDKVTILVQQLLNIFKRSLRFPISDGSLSSTLPVASLRANKMLGFDSSGAPIMVRPAGGEFVVAEIPDHSVTAIKIADGAVIEKIQPGDLVESMINDLAIPAKFGATRLTRIQLKGTGSSNSSPAELKRNSVLTQNTTRGLVVWVISKSGHSLLSSAVYDVYSGGAAQASMAAALDALGSDKVVCIASYESIALSADLRTALKRCGASPVVDSMVTSAAYPYALIGSPGIGEGNGIEMLKTTSSDDPPAEISGWLADDQIIGFSVGVSSKSLFSVSSRIDGVVSDLSINYWNSATTAGAISGLETSITASYTSADAATLSSANTYANSAISTYAYSKSTVDAALASQLSSITTAYQSADSTNLAAANSYANSAIASYAYSKSTVDSALASQLSSITTAYQSGDAATLSSANTYANSAISSYAYSKSTIDSSFASQLSTITASYTSADSAVLASANSHSDAIVSTEQTARTSADSSLATSINSVSARLNSGGDVNTAIVTAQSTATASQASVDAKYTLQVSAGNFVAGIALSASSGGGTSAIAMLCDKFAIAVPSAGPGSPVYYPFIVGNVNGVSQVGISGNLVVDNTILARHVSVSSLSAISANIGTVTSGLVQNAAGTNYMNLDATGSSYFISTPNFKVTASGNVTMTGTLAAGSVIANDLILTPAVLAGALNSSTSLKTTTGYTLIAITETQILSKSLDFVDAGSSSTVGVLISVRTQITAGTVTDTIFTVYRNGTLIGTYSFAAISGYYYINDSDTPGPGTHTYVVKAVKTGTGSINTTVQSILLIAGKR